MSKAHMPHWRYVACKLDGARAPGRRGLQTTLTQAARAAGAPEGELPELTRYEWPHFIVRVRHTQLPLARAWLPRIRAVRDAGADVAVQVETLATSGTIKTLTDRLGVLRKR